MTRLFVGGVLQILRFLDKPQTIEQETWPLENPSRDLLLNSSLSILSAIPSVASLSWSEILERPMQVSTLI